MSGLCRRKPLWELCQEGNVEGVREAVRQGKNVNGREESTGFTGLMYAATFRYNPLVKFLLKQQDIKINCQSRDGATALHMACLQDNVDALSMLVRHPSMTSLNTKHNTGDTPIMTAVKNGRANCVRELVALPGMDLKTRDSAGRSLEEVARWVYTS